MLALVAPLLLAFLAVDVVAADRAGAGASPPAPGSKRQQLLDTYSPVIAVQRQKDPCGSGERYRPMRVDYVLGRDDVVVRDGDGDVVMRAPTAADLAKLDDDHYLDFPGDALNPGCTYEKWFRTFDAVPSVYGRVTKDEGKVVVQYWIYWVFNQWNDVHESDWEMVQLFFDTDDVGEAIRKGPYLYAYSQHEGAEIAHAGDDKVQLVDGTHPTVYASGGSHASYFSSTRWFGKGGATGFGCDDTTGPLDRFQPEVVALPSEATDEGDHAWLAFFGRWGEKELLFNNGPTGPAAKGDKWEHPVAWVEEHGRDSSVALPFAGSAATKTFCNLSATGSELLNSFLDEPIIVVIALLLVVASIGFIFRLASRGLLGQARRTWWAHRRPLLVIGAVVVVATLVARVAQHAIVEWTFVGDLFDLSGHSSPLVLPLVAMTSAFVMLPATAWVALATVRVVDGERRAGRALSIEGGLGRPALAAAMIVIALIGLSLFVVPLFVIPASYWLIAPLVSVREQVGVRASLGRSWRLLKGYRWRSLALVVTLCLVLALSGLVGALVLLFTDLGFAAAGMVVAVVNAFLVPYVAIVVARYADEVMTARRERESVPTEVREDLDRSVQ